MCGICGYITLDGKKPAVTIKQIKNMLTNCMARGKHATGVYWTNNDTDNIFKLPVKATELIPLTPWREVLKSNICLMHTRFATQGNPDENSNNHPLYDENAQMILVHNGMINNSSNYVADTITDSYAVLEAYADCKTKRNTTTTALKKAITKLSGSMACAMYRRETERLFLWRSGNPLCIAYKKNTLFFASTMKIVSEVIPEYINIIPDNYMLTIKNGKTKGCKIAQKKISNWYDEKTDTFNRPTNYYDWRYDHDKNQAY